MALCLPDYAALHPFTRNLTENIPSVQFDHRVLATITAVLVSAAALVGMLRGESRSVRLAASCMGGAVIAQYCLGVATLLWVVPVGLATAHQATAVLLLTAALVTIHLRRSPP